MFNRRYCRHISNNISFKLANSSDHRTIIYTSREYTGVLCCRPENFFFKTVYTFPFFKIKVKYTQLFYQKKMLESFQFSLRGGFFFYLKSIIYNLYCIIL